MNAKTLKRIKEYSGKGRILLKKQIIKHMKCPYCKSDLKEGTTTLTFQMDPNRIVVVRDVPAWICEQCGEESVDMSVSKKVEKQVEKALSDGIRMGFIDFNHAA